MQANQPVQKYGAYLAAQERNGGAQIPETQGHNQTGLLCQRLKTWLNADGGQNKRERSTKGQIWLVLCALGYTGNYGRVWAFARDRKTSDGLATFKGAFKRAICSVPRGRLVALTAPAHPGACIRVFLCPDRVTRDAPKVESDLLPGKALLQSRWVQRQTVRINRRRRSREYRASMTCRRKCWKV